MRHSISNNQGPGQEVFVGLKDQGNRRSTEEKSEERKTSESDSSCKVKRGLDVVGL